jgi:hypothetical protein
MQRLITTLFEAAEQIGRGCSLTVMPLGVSEAARQQFRWCILETAQPVAPNIAEKLVGLPGIEVIQTDLFGEPVQWGRPSAMARGETDGSTR